MIAYKSLNVNSVAANFLVSRAAIYKHMKILSECGLMIIKQQGRERYCEARLKKLSQVSNWVEQYRQGWESKFESLDEYIKKMEGKRKKHVKRNVK
jgi:DNA-binding transcriptional ArsR family regulator